MVCMTLDYVGLTQISVIRIVYRSVDFKRFFIYLNFCYYRYFLLTFIFHKVAYRNAFTV